MSADPDHSPSHGAAAPDTTAAPDFVTAALSFESLQLRELQLREAEWMTREISEQESVIQRYRGLYITALFLSVGWIVGRLVAGSDAAAPTGDRLLDLQYRTDVAAILCFLPVVNVLFVALLIQATTELDSLRSYRRVLGRELGAGVDPWRWDLWQEGDRGPHRVWTTVLNVLLGVTLAVLTVAPLMFAFPAVQLGTSELLRQFWGTSFALVIALSVVVVAVTLLRLRRGAQRSWRDLVDHDGP